MSHRDVIVLGASAGGVTALAELVRGFPRNLPATVFAVLHLGPGKSNLPDILERAGPLPALHPVNGEPILPGRIYVAPPDCHLTLDDGHIRVARGPKENGHRPAVDVLFRSAARAYGPRVVGVVLTGNLDDGTAGLFAIKQRGGIAVVQDPAEADYPGMPQSALDHTEVDHVLRLAEMAPLLVELAHTPAPDIPHDPDEEEGTMGVTDESVGQSGQDAGGSPSGFTCPDCGGALWEWSEGRLVRFRCRTGHAYSPESLVSAQTESLEEALWAAVRSLEEAASLNRRIARRLHEKGSRLTAGRFRQRVEEAERNADILRGILDSFPTEVETESDIEVEVGAHGEASPGSG